MRKSSATKSDMLLLASLWYFKNIWNQCKTVHLSMRSPHLEELPILRTYFTLIWMPNSTCKSWLDSSQSQFSTVSQQHFLTMSIGFRQINATRAKKEGGPAFLSFGNLVTLFIKRFTTWGKIFPDDIFSLTSFLLTFSK